MKIFVNKKVFSIFLLIFLAGFLIWPNFGLAQKIEDINIKEIEKYLEIPEDKIESLLHSLINIFHTEWIKAESSGFNTAEERAVPNIMRAVVRVQVLNHLLVDASIETTWMIIKAGIKIVKVYIDPKVALEEIEKLTVEKAIEEGKKQLFQKKIRLTPGAIDFKYISRKGEEKIAHFQYIIIYKPSTPQRGEILIRFYLSQPLEPPISRGSPWGSVGIYTELKDGLPPFIVDIQGEVENYQWVGKPSMKIDFPPEVPDLGIKPLSFWERSLLQPIKTMIKEVEIIITKVTGGKNIVEDISKTATGIWNTIKSTVSRMKIFGEAGIGQVFLPAGQSEEKPATETKPPTAEESAEEAAEEAIDIHSSTSGVGEQKSLAELQEQLDDIAEQIDVLAQKVAVLTATKKQKIEKEIEKEKEELEELVEKEETKIKEKEKACQPNSININTASKEELQKITRVGPLIAQRIIEARPFSSLNDLLRVKGIGKKTLQKIIAQGCAYVEGFYSGDGAPPPSSPSPPPTSYPKILISEIQIWGNNINHDFIELYNPNDFKADISGYKLRKRTSTGRQYSINSLPSGSIIPAKGYYLWASSEDDEYPGIINADTWTKENIAENNSVAILAPNDTVISALAWGSSTNPFVEKNPFPDNPGKNQSLGRIWDDIAGKYKENGDNSVDFEIQRPTPKAQNQSPQPQPPTPSLTVVINEIAWMGTKASSNDEWIELHNPTKNPVDLTGWKLVSLTDGSPNITLSGTISPLGFYLLERTTSTVTNLSEDLIYTGGLNNDPKCEILMLYDPNNNLIDQTVCRENNDKSYWPAGIASPDYITMERVDPRISGEDPDNWKDNNREIRNGLDADDNPINGTPKAQNSIYHTLAPEAPGSFAIDTQNSYSNRVRLTWATSTDPDTLSENIFYEIYYSTEGEITEDNINETTTATTSQTSITLSNLDFNSTYYFGIKAFDGFNYSSLATTTSYRTAILATIASDFPVFPSNLTTINNGQKIVRTSNGNLYVVYSKDEKVFLAKSTDEGQSWLNVVITPDATATTSQKNPSIAIDSDNDLHIVWSGIVPDISTSTYQIRYVKYSQGSFSEIENLTNDENTDQQIPVIAVDYQNNIHIIWANAQQKLFHLTKNKNEVGWQQKEGVGANQRGIGSLNLAIDSQNVIHLVWQAMIVSGSSWHLVIYYQKYTDSWQPAGSLSPGESLTYAANSDYASFIIDNNNEPHFVWNGHCDDKHCYISYKKYTDSKKSQIASLPRYNYQTPHIAIDNNNHLYVIWNQCCQPKHYLYFTKYIDSWQAPKRLLEIEVDQLYPNLLWSLINQPKTGFAFIFYEGTELKFYASQDLTW